MRKPRLDGLVVRNRGTLRDLVEGRDQTREAAIEAIRVGAAIEPGRGGQLEMGRRRPLILQVEAQIIETQVNDRRIGEILEVKAARTESSAGEIFQTPKVVPRDL